MLFVCLLLLAGSQRTAAQDRFDDSLSVVVDTTILHKEMVDKWSTWRPDPKRAMWLALVIPGGGQIYNRKYWKLPIVYGGFIGCLYAMNWNNTMYKDYSQAYLDLMDNDPGTQSYNQFLHLGMQITPANEDRYKDIFKKRKEKPALHQKRGGDSLRTLLLLGASCRAGNRQKAGKRKLPHRNRKRSPEKTDRIAENRAQRRS